MKFLGFPNSFFNNTAKRKFESKRSGGNSYSMLPRETERDQISPIIYLYCVVCVNL